MTGMIAPWKITVCGIEELAGHCDARVSHVLSILDPEWPVPPAFGAWGEHERLELRFHDIIDEQPGMLLPHQGHVEQVLSFGRDLQAEPPAEAHLLVHCHAGVSRSTACMALLLAQALPDAPAWAVWDEVVRIRPIAWPNLRIVELGDALLGRRGALVEGARAVYQGQIALRPELAEEMREGPRAREAALAMAGG